MKTIIIHKTNIFDTRNIYVCVQIQLYLNYKSFILKTLLKTKQLYEHENNNNTQH